MSGTIRREEQESIMATTGSGAGKRVVLKVVIAVMVGLVVIGSLTYWKRYDIAVWIMRGSTDAQEMVIGKIQERAAPVIETEITMTFFQKVFGALTGRRNEKERQADALDDVREFNELSFQNHWFSFDVAHNRDSLHGFTLHGYDFVLGWNRGSTDEVLAEFDVDFKTRKLKRLLINEACSYFTDLKPYIEKRAKEN
jgi:hypothetical protein